MRENAKDLGLDHYEVRSFIGWYRHVTLVMLALAYLAGMCREENVPLLGGATPPTEPPTLLVLPLTVPEVRHLLGHLIGRFLATCRVRWRGHDGADAIRVAPATSTPNVVVICWLIRASALLPLC